MTNADILDSFGQPAAPHAPPELIRRFDFWADPEIERNPFAMFRGLRDQPRMVYNMHNLLKGQSWLPTRAKEIREILGNPTVFSSDHQAGFSELVGEHWNLGAVEMDPPQHTKIRSIMSPWISPPAVAKLSESVRARAVELIERIADRGGCEFVSSFSVPFPISIFMELFGLPKDQRDMFLVWVDQLLHQADPAVRTAGAKAIRDYLGELIEERRRKPGDDMVSLAVAAKVNGESLTYEEIMGICWVLFTGGLDTVTASLGWHFSHLATHPEYQARLRANPADIPRAIEEYMRYFSPVQSMRRATQDVEIGGVRIKAGDWIQIIHALASLDPEEFSNPDTVDFDRKSNRHFGFAYGIHFCVGAHLARREMQIAMQEWLNRIPTFHLVNDDPIEARGGAIFGLSRLSLKWG
jgi:cytochrome P450